MEIPEKNAPEVYRVKVVFAFNLPTTVASTPTTAIKAPTNSANSVSNTGRPKVETTNPHKVTNAPCRVKDLTNDLVSIKPPHSCTRITKSFPASVI